eukprot:4901085-Prymnesium_polylepis.1
MAEFGSSQRSSRYRSSCSPCGWRGARQWGRVACLLRCCWRREERGATRLLRGAHGGREGRDA